jgi:hypothetical protein
MTERFAMNGIDFAHLVGGLTGMARGRRNLLAGGLIVLGLLLIGLAWPAKAPRRGGSGEPLRRLRATLADAPAWQRQRPSWPKYLPEWSRIATTTAPLPGAATVTSAVIRGAVETTIIPSVAVGPELFGPSAKPLPPENLQPTPTKEYPRESLPSHTTIPRPLPSIVAAFPAALPVSSLPISLPTPAGTPVAIPVRSQSMEKLAVQSDQQIRHGLELANRGAYFAARAEFIAALRLIAQGLDSDSNSTLHSQALTAATTALREAQDFLPASGKLESELELSSIIAGHRTPVLKILPPQPMQAMHALKQYLTYAQEQFAVSAGQEVSGSVALGSLGKLHAAMARKPNPETVSAEAKAIVFFQAAILVCPQNFMAANDLGVLLAQSKDTAGARRYLEHSVLICRCSDNLSNLSLVYRQIGESRLAELAAEKCRRAKESEIARQKSASLAAGGTVEWVDPSTLVQSSDQWIDPPARPATTFGQQGPATPPPTPKPVVGILPVPFGPATAR